MVHPTRRVRRVRRLVGGTSRFPRAPSTGPLRGQAAAPPVHDYREAAGAPGWTCCPGGGFATEKTARLVARARSSDMNVASSFIWIPPTLRRRARQRRPRALR